MSMTYDQQLQVRDAARTIQERYDQPLSLGTAALTLQQLEQTSTNISATLQLRPRSICPKIMS